MLSQNAISIETNKVELDKIERVAAEFDKENIYQNKTKAAVKPPPRRHIS